VTKLLCLAREEGKLLLGKPSNVVRCSTAFARSFANAETGAHGACPTNGDAASVEQRVDDAHSSVLAALQAPLAATDTAKRCVATKDQAAARFAICTGKQLSQRLGGHAVGEQITRCNGSLADAFAAAEARGGCPTIDDSVAVGALANPAGMNLSNVVFDAASQSLALLDLTGADLRNANLSHVDATGAKLINADLSNANLDFLYAPGPGPLLDLSGAKLTNASLTGADIRYDNLSGADLSGTSLVTVALTRVVGANLAGCPAALPAGWSCTLNNLVGPTVDLRNANLSGADLSGRDLNAAQFSLVNLANASLANANLSNAAFFLPDLTGTNLTGANASLLFISGAVWSNTSCPDGTNSATNGSSPESCCAHLSVPDAGCSP
jgi:uncharacterized protein YjbI with pentapeptide repeats